MGWIGYEREEKSNGLFKIWGVSNWKDGIFINWYEDDCGIICLGGG